MFSVEFMRMIIIFSHVAQGNLEARQTCGAPCQVREVNSFLEVWLEDVICQRFLCWGISLKVTIPHRHIFSNCSYYILGRYIKLSRRVSEGLFLSTKHPTCKETHSRCTLHNKPVKVFRGLLTRRVTLANFSLLNTIQAFVKARDVTR